MAIAWSTAKLFCEPPNKQKLISKEIDTYELLMHGQHPQEKEEKG